MNPEVAEAIAEIQQAFAANRVQVIEEPQGGAHIIVYDLDIGASYQPTTTWVGFSIPFQYPHADIYPHFMDGSVRRADGQPFGPGLTGPTPWQNRSALQVSRRSPQWNAATDTAALKLLKVLEWIRSQ